jgi:uncharacterized protein YndB with AHSA1/START domain
MQDIHHVFDVAAPRPAVFEAITREKGLSAWWTTTVHAEEGVGALVKFTFARPGEKDERGRVLPGFAPQMRIVELEPDSLLVWECVGGAEPWLGARITFSITDERPGAVRVRFTQGYAKELSADEFGIYNYNWAYYLESLRLFCEDGAGKPFQAS